MAADNLTTEEHSTANLQVGTKLPFLAGHVMGRRQRPMGGETRTRKGSSGLYRQTLAQPVANCRGISSA
jgi:hypothetical protein